MTATKSSIILRALMNPLKVFYYLWTGLSAFVAIGNPKFPQFLATLRIQLFWQPNQGNSVQSLQGHN